MLATDATTSKHAAGFDAADGDARPGLSIQPFEAADLLNMVLQDAQAWAKKHVSPAVARQLEETMACTVRRGDRVLACVGVAELEPHRGLVWSFLAKDIGRDLLPLTRRILDYFAESPYERLEAQVDVHFEAGHRWIKMLGFQVESPLLAKFRRDGGDCVGYVRLK